MALTDRERDTDPAPPPLAFSGVRLGELYACVWSGHADGEAVRALRAELEEIIAERGTVSVLHVVVESAPAQPSAEARALAVEMLRDFGSAVRSIAVVVEGGGFWGATVRGMFLAIATALRPRFRWKIFSTTAPAITWLLPHLSPRGTTSAVEIASQVEALRPKRSVAGI